MQIAKNEEMLIKKIMSIIGSATLYFAVVFGCAFLGFVSPELWVFSPAIAAFFTSIPITILLNKYHDKGITLVFPAIYFIIGFAIGEITMVESILAMLIVAIIAEIVHIIMTPGTANSTRMSCAVLSLVPACNLLSLWIRTDYYYIGAVEEMGIEYADALMTFSDSVFLIALIVSCLAVGHISSSVVERIIKKANKTAKT